MPLAELAKFADQTQRAVTRIARGMIDGGRGGRASQSVIEATALSLTGISSGSTVLDIAAPAQPDGTLLADEMPASLGELALEVFVESLELLAGSDAEPVLPIGVDDSAVKGIDQWLSSVRGYYSVIVDAELRGTVSHVRLVPRDARARLKTAQTQPSLPYVSADHQVLTGRLYALNLRTGSFSIEDNARHTIRLSVPGEVRADAAQLVGKTVRALGRASIDNRRRLLAFEVASLEQVQGLLDQMAFFERHDLPAPAGVVAESDLRDGVIDDLSHDEIEDFIAALGAIGSD